MLIIFNMLRSLIKILATPSREFVRSCLANLSNRILQTVSATFAGLGQLARGLKELGSSSEVDHFRVPELGA